MTQGSKFHTLALIKLLLVEVVDNFCILGDLINGGRGYTESVFARIGIGWRKFSELLPLVLTKELSLTV